MNLKQRSHSSVWKRVVRVGKIAKFHIRQAHVGNTFKTRYKRAGYAWCTSGARRCTSLRVSRAFVLKKFLNMLKNFLKARRVSGVRLIRPE